MGSFGAHIGGADRHAGRQFTLDRKVPVLRIRGLIGLRNIDSDGLRLEGVNTRNAFLKIEAWIGCAARNIELRSERIGYKQTGRGTGTLLVVIVHGVSAADNSLVFFFLRKPHPPNSTLFPHTALSR